MSRTLLIGDIHGCHGELLELLDRAGIDDDDRIIALGDIVDRGPDTPAVLDFFRTRPGATSILGNHERKHLRCARGELRPALAQILTRRQIGEEHHAEALSFVSGFSLYLDLPECLALHGFLEPGVPLAEQRETVLVGTMSGEQHIRRTCGDRWYETYDGWKPLVVGHLNYLGGSQPLVYRDRVFGLDTDCCHGRALTALLLPAFRLISVPAARDYWADAVREAAHLLRPPLCRIPWNEVEDRARAAAPVMAEDQRAFVEDALGVEERLLGHVERENDRLLGTLRAEHPYDGLDAPEQGRLYARVMGATPLKHLLHAARKGRLDRVLLRTYCRTPRETIDMARKVGLVAAAPEPWSEAEEVD